MIRDNVSDTLEYRYSFSSDLLGNYWSEDNICHCRADPYLLDGAVAIMQNSEMKEHSISDEQLTSGMDQSMNTGSKSKAKSVSINEENNQVNVVNRSDQPGIPKQFKPGGQKSPSLLGDQSLNQNKSGNITGKKRDKNPEGQISAIHSPLKKKRRLSQINSNDNNNINVDNQTA